MDKDIENLIAPPALKINSNYIQLGEKYVKTLFIFTYPRYLSTGWFSPIINLPNLLDIAIHVHPIDTGLALKNLRKKAAQVESQVNELESKGYVRGPMPETALQDIENLRDSLQQSRENLFNVGVYITIYADTLQDLNKLEAEITTLLETRLVC